MTEPQTLTAGKILSERPQFRYAELRGLLGEFNHRVQFDDGQDMVILYGPNGVGKTHVLEFIHHALRGDWFRLQDMPFDSAEIGYDDGLLCVSGLNWPTGVLKTNPLVDVRWYQTLPLHSL